MKQVTDKLQTKKLAAKSECNGFNVKSRMEILRHCSLMLYPWTFVTNLPEKTNFHLEAT